MRFATVLLVLLALPVTATETLRVAVAANFRPTLESINQGFEAETGIAVVLSSASTGVLATQIQYGAPFDILFAADRETPEKLAAMLPKPVATPRCYAIGSLVLASRGDGLQQLARPELSLAIANPATAPYGRAAMQVLARSEFATGAKRKLVRGNNAIQTYQFWHSGAVAMALLPKALAPATATPVPLDWHDTLEQHLLALRPSSALDAYLKWIRSANVQALISQAGYQPCP